MVSLGCGFLVLDERRFGGMIAPADVDRYSLVMATPNYGNLLPANTNRFGERGRFQYL
jgi:hypothetical protein